VDELVGLLHRLRCREAFLRRTTSTSGEAVGSLGLVVEVVVGSARLTHRQG
jgi:hypothetical protein